ncbi:MAG: hypothetical protein QF492_06390 [Candidatus Krumholzibacteria bacterium]|nr:hypothetical protein [Candidatus Krumholzibacteria bacterium]MDP6669513.1 hypothetical protein [Candidatus Krumholzibacteria bacterium]MDP6797835.1 hypothetical protein [Candidatus Krumholzibacteria bacterium]MDP7022513.1 hypothetical protein [Candidatus Krumholzibacteria bacterium]
MPKRWWAPAWLILVLLASLVWELSGQTLLLLMIPALFLRRYSSSGGG